MKITAKCVSCNKSCDSVSLSVILLILLDDISKGTDPLAVSFFCGLLSGH